MKTKVVIVVLLAVIAGGGYYGYEQFLALQKTEAELAALREEKDKLQQQAAAAAGEMDGKVQLLAGLEQKARELDAARAALAGGLAISILESAVKSVKVPTAEHYLAIGAVRLVANGSADKEVAVAYEHALQIANWPSSMKLACAAQAGIVAAGGKIEISSDCGRVLTATGQVAAAAPPGAGDGAKTADAPQPAQR